MFESENSLQSMAKRLLLISPYFPPLNAIGSKRAVNIVQGLTSLGWNVDILCTEAFFESENTTYQFEIPEGVTVYRGFVSRTLRPILTFFKSDSKPSIEKKITRGLPKPTKPGVSLTPFDQYLWDVSGAVKSGKKMIKKARPDVILVNADPWSGLLVGQKLSEWSGVPWVADFRDPWTAFEEKMQTRPKPIQKVIKRYEKAFFQSASAVILNTENAMNRYMELYPDNAINSKFTFIRNAFNTSLLDLKKVDVKNSAPFVFGYFGSFRGFVSPKSLLEGFSKFIDAVNLTANDVRVELVGSASDEFHYYADKYELADFISINPQVSYKDSLKVLRRWQVLMLVVDPAYKLMVPAKLYDYLHARRPILALSENTEVNSIIQNTSSGNFVSNNDVQSIAHLFREAYLKYQGVDLLNNEAAIAPYGRQAQSEKFDCLLRQVLTKA